VLIPFLLLQCLRGGGLTVLELQGLRVADAGRGGTDLVRASRAVGVCVCECVCVCVCVHVCVFWSLPSSYKATRTPGGSSLMTSSIANLRPKTTPLTPQ
jgi:hypothetical protein